MQHPVPDGPFTEDPNQEISVVDTTRIYSSHETPLCASHGAEMSASSIQSPQLHAETVSSKTPFPQAPLDFPSSHAYTRTDFPFTPSHPNLRYPPHRRRRTKLPGLFPSLRQKLESRPRIHSLEREPLAEEWIFPSSKRFRPGPDYRTDLTPFDISKMVTSGYLLVDDMGIQWADSRVYFLIEIKAGTLVPVPVPVPVAEGVLRLKKEHIMSAAVERYAAEEEVLVPTEKPVTPIVEKDDPVNTSAPTTPGSDKKVRFDRKRLSLDLGSGLEESSIVIDNEGKTPRA